MVEHATCQMPRVRGREIAMPIAGPTGTEPLGRLLFVSGLGSAAERLYVSLALLSIGGYFLFPTGKNLPVKRVYQTAFPVQ